MFNTQVLRRWTLVAIVGQIMVLAFMAGKREYIHRFGTEILLRSAPIDPRDPFRGDFVRLDYAMSRVHKSQLSGEAFNAQISKAEVAKGTVVYAQLHSDANGIYHLNYLSKDKPGEGLFIKGRTHKNWRWGFRGEPDSLSVRYGIEQYFVQQGKGKDMEDKMGKRDALQIPIVMRVGLGSDGTAVIKDHQWSKLGIQLEVVRVPTPRRNVEQVSPDDTISPIVEVSLKNVSAEVVSIFDFGEQCSFQLFLAGVGTVLDTRLDQGCIASVPLLEQVISLQPDEVYSVTLDFSRPRWHILKDDKRVEMGAVDTWQGYRIVYKTPSPDQTLGLQGKGLEERHNFWFGQIPTPSFRGHGRVD